MVEMAEEEAPAPAPELELELRSPKQSEEEEEQPSEEAVLARVEGWLADVPIGGEGRGFDASDLVRFGACRPSVFGPLVCVPSSGLLLLKNSSISSSCAASVFRLQRSSTGWPPRSRT